MPVFCPQPISEPYKVNDVTKADPQRLAALRCHASQTAARWKEIQADLDAAAAAYGKEVGARLGEPYRESLCGSLEQAPNRNKASSNRDAPPNLPGEIEERRECLLLYRDRNTARPPAGYGDDSPLLSQMRRLAQLPGSDLAELPHALFHPRLTVGRGQEDMSASPVVSPRVRSRLKRTGNRIGNCRTASRSVPG